MQDDELTKAIQFEAHKYIPSSLDEVAMSWEIIEHEKEPAIPIFQSSGKDIKSKKIKLLLVAAPKKDIQRYEQLISNTKLKVKAIELETFSLVRSLVGDDNGVFLTIDIGARSTNIVLVEKNIVISNRSIDAGGDEITLSISESMNISKQRAEILKKSKKNILNEKESYSVIPILEFIANESKRIMNAYRSKSKDARIDSVILSGGTAKMEGIEEYFTKILEINSILGNPWRRIEIPENARSLVKELGASFSVALGLALRGMEEYKRK
jgi:type IV pilus assembly protein PilM